MKNEMHALLTELFPFCRSLTGDGVRKTLDVLKKKIPLQVHEIPSGTNCFDWQIPDEWNIQDAYIKDSAGNRIVDFKKNNLHVMGYSIPFEGKLPLAELKKHLHTLPNQKDAIPYVTSYYNRNWGFCLSQNQLDKMPEGTYEVKIDSSLKAGYLTYGELLIKGESEKEILLSTNICHPSLANNELSGPVVTTYLALSLLAKRKRKCSYRILFVPETIGAIAYLSRHWQAMKKNTCAGYVITCIGNEAPFSYLQSPHGNTLTDRVTKHVLEKSGVPFKLYPFLDRGSDERQYCAPGIDLPIGSLMRSKYGTYPEYHTSLDNLDFVTGRALEESVKLYTRCLEAIEANAVYRTTVLCEPMLGKRGLYPKVSNRESIEKVTSGSPLTRLFNFWTYCDGKQDLLSIAEKIGSPIWDMEEAVNSLVENELIETL